MNITYGNHSLSAEDVLKHLALLGQARPLGFEIIKNRVLEQKAREMDLQASDQQLQQFADAYRAGNALYSAQETLDFLAASGLTGEDFEGFCESSVLKDLLRDRIADEDKVRDYFINHRSDFDRARISMILMDRAELANEVKLQIEEEELEFADAAQTYSLEPGSKHQGGYMGLITRRSLAPDVSAKVFNASPKELLGPLEEAGAFQLILVHAVIRAELKPDLQEMIKDMIVDEWAETLIRDSMTTGMA